MVAIILRINNMHFALVLFHYHHSHRFELCYIFDQGSFPFLPFTTASRPALGPIQPPIQ